MPKTALILGANGRFGRNMQAALTRHGWTVRAFDRSNDTLPDAAIGADLIVNAWNPPYANWAKQIPALTRTVIAAAKSSGAAVLIPGNIYVFGEDLPPILRPETPHRATNPLGLIRRNMERAYREAGVKTIILRAGDFLDTEASGNWFDRIIAAKIGNGQFRYPGPLDQVHQWNYLPDLTEAGAQLANRLDHLPTFTDVIHGGHALTGAELAQAIEHTTGQKLKARQMAWWPIKLSRPVWSEARHILEMSYLWRKPHRADGSALSALVPDLPQTPLPDVIASACAPLLQNEMSTQTRRWSEA